MHECICSGIVGRHVGSSIRERESERNYVVVFEMEKVWEGRDDAMRKGCWAPRGQGSTIHPSKPRAKVSLPPPGE